MLAASLFSFEAVWLALKADSIPLLTDNDQAQWITMSEPVSLMARKVEPVRRVFARKISLAGDVPHLSVEIRVFRSAKVYVNGTKVLSLSRSEKRVVRGKLDIGRHLKRGNNSLLIEVENDVGPPLLWLNSEASALKSGGIWRVTADGNNWHPVQLATEIESVQLSDQIPTPLESLIERSGWIFSLFTIGFISTLVILRAGIDSVSERVLPLFRYLLLFLLGLLYWHNAPQLPFHIGMDAPAHHEYLNYVISTTRLPMAGDGWQMFQPPLAYLLNAILVDVSRYFAPEINVATVARVTTMVVALLTAHFAAKVAEAVLSDRPFAQWLAVCLAMTMPMAIYMSHSFANEPYFALFGVMMIYWIVARMEPAGGVIRYRDATLLGILCGLALLTKVTALILCLAIALAFLVRQIRAGAEWRLFLKMVSLFCFWVVIIAGWWYLRNFIEMGRPFVGGWESRDNIVWWQYPGYRTINSLLGFGSALTYPLYAGAISFWDGIWSTLWGDGQLSGIVRFAQAPRWNYAAMHSLYLIAIPLTGLLWLGMARVLFVRNPTERGIHLELFTVSLILLIWAMFHLYASVPIYSSAKASYMLVMVPGIAVLVAWGADLIARSQLIKAMMAGLCSVWVGTVYQAFLITAV